MEEAREVETAEVEAIAEGYEEVIDVLETSAKEDINVTEAMQTLARKLKEQHSNSSSGLASGDNRISIGGRTTGNDGFRLGGSSLGDSKSTCCSSFG